MTVNPDSSPPPKWWVHRECDTWPDHACECCALYAAGKWDLAFDLAVEYDEDPRP